MDSSDLPISCAFDIRRLSAQEERYVQLRVRGLLPLAAARGAGIRVKNMSDINALHDANPHLDEALVAYRMAIREESISRGVEIEFTRNDATLMLMEAHTKAANTMEEVRAIDSLIKLHGIAAPERKEITATVTNISEIQQMSDEQLAALSGRTLLLDPTQYMEVKNGETGTVPKV